MSPQDPPATTRRPLRLEKEALVITTDADHDVEDDDEEVVVASNRSGGSLTLLEELSMRESKGVRKNFVLALLCGSVSVTFAVLTFQKL